MAHSFQGAFNKAKESTRNIFQNASNNISSKFQGSLNVTPPSSPKVNFKSTNVPSTSSQKIKPKDSQSSDIVSTKVFNVSSTPTSGTLNSIKYTDPSQSQSFSNSISSSNPVQFSDNSSCSPVLSSFDILLSKSINNIIDIESKFINEDKELTYKLYNDLLSVFNNDPASVEKFILSQGEELGSKLVSELSHISLTSNETNTLNNYYEPSISAFPSSNTISEDFPSIVENSKPDILKVNISLDSVNVKDLSEIPPSEYLAKNTTNFGSPNLDSFQNSKIESCKNVNALTGNPQLNHLESESKVDININVSNSPDFNLIISENSVSIGENSIVENVSTEKTNNILTAEISPKASNSSENRTVENVCTPTNKSNINPTIYCIFCRSETHSSHFCTKFSSNKEFWQVIYDEQRCKNCFRQFHMSHKCFDYSFCLIRNCLRQDKHSPVLCKHRYKKEHLPNFQKGYAKSYPNFPHFQSRNCHSFIPQNSFSGASKNFSSKASQTEISNAHSAQVQTDNCASHSVGVQTDISMNLQTPLSSEITTSNQGFGLKNSHIPEIIATSPPIVSNSVFSSSSHTVSSSANYFVSNIPTCSVTSSCGRKMSLCSEPVLFTTEVHEKSSDINHSTNSLI